MLSLVSLHSASLLKTEFSLKWGFVGVFANRHSLPERAEMARLERAQTVVGVALVASGVLLMCLVAMQVRAVLPALFAQRRSSLGGVSPQHVHTTSLCSERPAVPGLGGDVYVSLCVVPYVSAPACRFFLGVC